LPRKQGGGGRNRRRGRSPVHAPGDPGRRPAGKGEPQDRPQFRHPAVAAERDGTPSGRRRRAAPRENGGIRKVVREEAETVDACDACGADLPGIDPVGRERRVQAGIVFEIVGSSVEAWTKERPGRGSRTAARSPDDMLGPPQYGNGLQEFVIDLLVAQMLPLRRAVGSRLPCPCPASP